jgi:hypothetical protein
MTSDFHQLSNSIGSYSMSIPPQLASYAALKADGHVDVALVTAHALPHLATLLLHDPMVNTRNESFTLCSAACSGVLGILRVSPPTCASGRLRVLMRLMHSSWR